MTKLMLGLVACLALFACADAHYYMERPLMRGSLYLKDPKHYKKNINHNEWCEVHNKKTNEVYANDRNATCGVAGPIYNNDPTKDCLTCVNCNPHSPCREETFRSVEYGSKYYTGEIHERYGMGEDITVIMKATASHGGRVSFSLCEAKADGSDPSVDCFEKKKSKLMVKSVKKKTFENYYTFPSDSLFSKFTRTLKVRLPKNVTCKHCILRYKIDQTFPPKTKQGHYDLYKKRMKNPSQIYVGAADIEIFARGG